MSSNSPTVLYAWTRYRIWRLSFFAVPLTGMFLVCLLVHYDAIPKHLLAPLWLGYMLLVAVPVMFRFGAFPCPRCKNPLHYRGGFGDPFAKRCLHCDLKIGGQSE